MLERQHEAFRRRNAVAADDVRILRSAAARVNDVLLKSRVVSDRHTVILPQHQPQVARLRVQHAADLERSLLQTGN